ncbi:glycosyltransferase [Arhodomonas sp. KWT]|uniref:glycosyltransferase n=1 Tax=Arhodomonas sp. KWT TaxID=2679915 RepID=UPI001F08DE2C|nr:glycosyltransferase [Arhodomonas sp. KWT]
MRYLQYLPYFRDQGVTVEVAPLFSDAYLQALYNSGSRWREVLAGYMRRFGALGRARRFDVLIVEKELYPFLPAVVERLLRAMGVPYVADYDDALFHRYDRHPRALVRRLLGRKIDAVMRHAAVVVAGNEYLAARARKAGADRVEVIPTVVDTERYRLLPGPANEVPVVGWIGTPRTSRYLQALLPVFEALQREVPVRFAAVGAREADFAGTPVEAWPWSVETEVSSIQKFDIGIMPLQDSPWERGKCGYKLIQYMACGVPVVASPVGVNREIVTQGENGLLAETAEEWQKALQELLQRGEAGRRTMGAVGRERVEHWYSLEAQAPRFLAAVKGAVR